MKIMVSALPDRGLLVRGTEQEADHRLSGFKTRRISVLQAAGGWQDQYQREGRPGGDC